MPTCMTQEKKFTSYNLEILTVIPSKFVSVMPPGCDFDSIPFKKKFNKSSVSRPIRHFGRPPGFNTIVSKSMDDPVVGVNLRGGNPYTVLDDYSWLDGCHLLYPSYSCVW